MKDIVRKMEGYFQLITIGCHHEGNQVEEFPVCLGGEGVPALPGI